MLPDCTGVAIMCLYDLKKLFMSIPSFKFKKSLIDKSNGGVHEYQNALTLRDLFKKNKGDIWLTVS